MRPPTLETKTSSTMDPCTRFANQLMLKMVEESTEKNIVVSPFLINVVLNMIAIGSKGDTLGSMLDFLGSKVLNEIKTKSREMMSIAADVGFCNNGGGPILAIVNGAWADQRCPFKSSYKEKVLKGIFNCEAKTVDFANQADQIREEINAWAEAATRGLIKGFLGPGSPSPESALVLANALYFKGTWANEYKFDAERTEDKDFYLLNGDMVSVPFMTSWEYYPFGSFDGFKVLEIPYESGELDRRFSMYFILPNERDGLQNVLKMLVSNPGIEFKLSEKSLDKLWIPKFKFSYNFDVSETIKDLGIPLSLISNPTDSSRMFDVRVGVPFIKHKIIQKACIEIDEKGTEAAAVTEDEEECGCSMYEPKRPSFVADHPFVFMIKEAKSGLGFFTGAVLDPTQSD